jgi:rhamnulose-1-phosphate aldolase/alcohol dehydrogenase
MPDFHHVSFLWDDAMAASLDPVGRLVYRSNLLGRDTRITNTGGGNTSAKIVMSDPAGGAPAEVLWVKGSGGDLRTSTRDNFAALRWRQLLELQQVYAARGDKGLKSPAEDDMVDAYRQAAFGGSQRAPSIDTPLHAFLPGRHVDHMHPNAIIAIAASANCARITREVFGDEMAFVPWMRPGFELGLAMQAIARENSRCRAIMMAQHGFIAWADDDRECYTTTLRLIEKAAAAIERAYAARGGDAAAFGGQGYRAPSAESRRATLAAVLPWLRRRIAERGAAIATVQDDERVLRFVNSHDAPRLAALGTSCPDHFLRTKIRPLYVDWDPVNEDQPALCEKLTSGLENYRRDYAAYYTRHRGADSPAMRDPNPTVVLIPGLGLIAWGRDKSESRVTAEFYTCAIAVMRGAEAIDRYVALPPQEAFDIEYWSLEEAKLRRMPPEKPLAREVVIVMGAGSAKGREASRRLAAEGAHVVCVDADEAGANATAQEIVTMRGAGIGVAGTGISGCGPAFGMSLATADRASVQLVLETATLAYGGFDAVVLAADPAAFDDAATGVVAGEAGRIWREQGVTGMLVMLASPDDPAAARLLAETEKVRSSAVRVVMATVGNVADMLRRPEASSRAGTLPVRDRL